MDHPNSQDNSCDPSAAPSKRKRGRPRKDEVSLSIPNKRGRQLYSSSRPSISLVGREVSCSLIGVFDAGFLISVQVGSSGPHLRGLVFDPRRCIPVSAENDIAPHLPMLRRRNAFTSPPAEAIEYPASSSFGSHVQTDLKLSLLEAMPSQSGGLSPKTSNGDLHSQAIKNEHAPNDCNALKTSEALPIAVSEAFPDASKGVHSDVSKPSETSVEAASVDLKPSEASLEIAQFSQLQNGDIASERPFWRTEEAAEDPNDWGQFAN